MTKVKYILAIICLLIPVTIQAGQQQGAGEPQSAAPTCDTTNVIFWWRAEAFDFSGTNGTLDYSANDDTGTSGSAAAINADAVKYGTNGLDIPTSSDTALFDTLTSTIDDEGRVGFWLYINTWGDGANIFDFYRSSNDTFGLAMNGTDELAFYWTDSTTARTTLVTNNSNLSTGTWYFIEAAWKSSTNLREIYVDGVERTYSQGDGATIASFSNVPIYNRFGNGTAVSADFYMDNIIVSTDSTVDLNTVCKDQVNYDGS